MLYFLVIAIPFILTIYYLIRNMYKLRKEFDKTRDIIMQLCQKENIMLDKDILKSSKDLIITTDIIKKMELSIKPLEQKVDRSFVFISNTMVSKKQKLIKIQDKVKKLEAFLNARPDLNY